MIATFLIPRKALEIFHRFHHAGILTEEDAEQRHAYLITGRQGHYLIGNCVILYWLVEKQSGKILDAKFQYFGHPYLLILAEISCSLVRDKPCSEGLQLSFEDLDRSLHSSATSFPVLPESEPLYHMILDAIDGLADECKQLSLISQETPFTENNPIAFPNALEISPHTTEEWERLSLEQRTMIIKQFVANHIEPFVAIDGGQVCIEHLSPQHLVTIAYSGNCSSCFSSLGSTLNSISQLLKTHVYAELQVKVNEASLNFSAPAEDPQPPFSSA